MREAREELPKEVLEEGLEPSRGLRPTGFSYYDSFRYPSPVRSLDFLLAVDVRFRPQPQSLYTFFFFSAGPPGPGTSEAANRPEEAWLGIATTITC